MAERFHFETFNNLAVQSLEKAEEYRDKCHGVKNTPVVEVEKETFDTITSKVEESVVEAEKLVNNEGLAEIDVLRAEYKEKFGKKPSSKMKLESLREKLKQD